MVSDAIDVSAVELHNSPDIRAWAATTAITALHFKGDAGVLVDFTKRDGPGSWPNVTPPGWGDGNIEFTIWMFLNIGGVWHGAGCSQCYRGDGGAGDIVPNGGDVGLPGQIPKNWFYDAGRWGPMAGYQPARGELVGFMVSAGDARGPADVTLRERSNIVLVPFPAPGVSDVIVPQAPADPGPTPTPAPGQPPAANLAQLLEAIQRSEDMALIRHSELMAALESLHIVGTVKIPYIGTGILDAKAAAK